MRVTNKEERIEFIGKLSDREKQFLIGCSTI